MRPVAEAVSWAEEAAVVGALVARQGFARQMKSSQLRLTRGFPRMARLPTEVRYQLMGWWRSVGRMAMVPCLLRAEPPLEEINQGREGAERHLHPLVEVAGRRQPLEATEILAQERRVGLALAD